MEDRGLVHRHLGIPARIFRLVPRGIITPFLEVGLCALRQVFPPRGFECRTRGLLRVRAGKGGNDSWAINKRTILLLKIISASGTSAAQRFNFDCAVTPLLLEGDQVGN
jgi:hypothetical protein